MKLWFYIVKDKVSDLIETDYLLAHEEDIYTVSLKLNEKLGENYQIKTLQLMSTDVLDLR